MFKLNRFGLIGIIIALLGIGCAVFQGDLRKQFIPNALEVERSALGESIKMLISDDSVQVEHDRIDYLYLGLGLLALILGIISFLSKESQRVSLMAGVLGIMALTWQYVLIGVIIAVVIIIIYMLVSNFS